MSHSTCLTSRDQADHYISGSEVVHFEAFGAHTIIVNTARAANELFEKRSALYSDRPVRSFCPLGRH